MIIFRYSKLGGAEYISHLDTLRHIGKTLIRAKISVEYSQGFNPHMQIYLSPPVFVGLKSRSEYCLVETDEKAQSFIEKFNRYSPKNIKLQGLSTAQNIFSFAKISLIRTKFYLKMKSLLTLKA